MGNSSNDNNTGQILLLVLLIVLPLFIDYLFLTEQLGWRLHELTQIPFITKIHDTIKNYPRIALILLVVFELLISYKKIIKRIKIVLFTFIPTAILFFYVDIFVDRIVSIIFPALFGILFYFYFIFKEPKEASISSEDLNAEDFKLAKEVQVSKYSVNLMLHDGDVTGYLNMPNPFRGILILGGAGSGKTYAVFEPIMFQFVMKDFVLFNYDYKFPDLTNSLQKCLDFREYAGKENYPHYVLNFNDPCRSHRCNPIDPTTIEDTIELTSIATVFIQNIKKEWVKNKDFWADAAIAYLNSLILYLYRNHPDKCYFPHVIELGCKPYGTVIDMLLSDPECAKLMVSYAQAVKDKAGAQLAGMSGSLQVFLPNLSKPSIYWALSSNDFTLDFNNPENPHHISLGNDPGLRQQFLQPIIGCISKIALSKANRNYENLQEIRGIKKVLKQIPCGLMFDELVTTYIEDLDQVPNTGRSNLLALCIGIQMSPQLIDKYGQDKYKVLMGSFGNLFAGLVNDPDSAKIISEIFDKKKLKIKNEGVSTSHDNKESGSLNYSYQNEQAVPIGTLTTQPQGHFYGKYTVEFNKDRDLTKIEKKPFFKGTVFVEEVKKFSDVSNPLDPMVPIKMKLTNKYMIPEFIKFSNAIEYADKQKDMKTTLDNNYQRIIKEVDDILNDFQHKKDLSEIEANSELKKLSNSSQTSDDDLYKKIMSDSISHLTDDDDYDTNADKDESNSGSNSNYLTS